MQKWLNDVCDEYGIGLGDIIDIVEGFLSHYKEHLEKTEPYATIAIGGMQRAYEMMPGLETLIEIKGG